jgi:hypothetical protein
MDIATRKKISKTMQGHSNFEGKHQSHKAKLAIASARRGKDNIKGRKWSVNKKTGEEHRGYSLPGRSKWGRVAAFKTWIHSNDKAKHEETVMSNDSQLDEGKKVLNTVKRTMSMKKSTCEGMDHILQAKQLINQSKREKTGNFKYMDYLKKLREKHGAAMSTAVHKAASKMSMGEETLDEVSVELANKVYKARHNAWRQDMASSDKLAKAQKAGDHLAKKQAVGYDAEKHRKHVYDSLGKAGVHGIQGKDISYYHGNKAIATHSGLSTDKHFGGHFSIHTNGEVKKHPTTKAALDAIQESVEVNELDKKTLDSYIHKSFAAGNELHKQIDTAKTPEEKAALKAKLSQRNTGVIRAAKRLRAESMDSFHAQQHSDENIPPEYELTDKERAEIYGKPKKTKQPVKKTVKEALGTDAGDLGWRHGNQGSQCRDFDYKRGSPEQAKYKAGYEAGKKAKGVDMLAKIKARAKSA